MKRANTLGEAVDIYTGESMSNTQHGDAWFCDDCGDPVDSASDWCLRPSCALMRLERDEWEAREKAELRRWAENAINVQDACNLSGVVMLFAELMSWLCTQGLDTERRNNHPLAVMFACKVASLTGCDTPHMEPFSTAYAWCKEMVK